MNAKVVSLLCYGFCGLLHSQSQIHTATVDIDFSPRESPSYWVNGYFVKYSRALDRATPAVRLVDRNGHQITPPTPIAFDGVPFTEIHAVTADTSGNLYASVEAWAQGGPDTGVICKVSPGGKSIQAFRIGDFVPVALAVTKSGEIWAFGLPLEFQTAKTTQTDYMTLWRIDASGKVIDKLLPRSSFGPDVIPTHAASDIGSPRLWASGTRVGLYSAKANRWMEFDAATGNTVADLRPPRPIASDGSSGALTGVVLMDSGDVYAHFGYLKAVNEGSGFYKLDKAHSKWVPLIAPACPDGCVRLYGAEGDDLIMRSGSGTSHSWTFAWIDAGTLAPIAE